MGIILTEGQLNKLVKAVLKEDAGPSRYRKHEKDLKEIDLYKFSEPRTEKKYGPEDYRDVITSSTPVKTVGEFSYYYVDSEDNYAPVIKFFVV